MPVLHTLCASSSLPNTMTSPQLSNLSAKPSTLNSSAGTPRAMQTDFPLPLPELPGHVREKILSLEVMGIDSGRALSLNPALRSASLDSINSIISYLQSKGIHHKDLGRILGMCPKILTASIRSDLRPVFQFLSQDLQVPESNCRRVINKCPRLLASSVRDQLKPALIYLQRLGFRDTDALAYQDPILLVSSVEKTMIPKLQYLVGLGLSREEAVGMVLRCPGLFTFSIEKNFKPKYEYFVREMAGTLEDLKEFPQFFAFSLEKRIKPRHQELMEKGIMKVPLSVMLKSTDEEFKELIQKGS
ncbi:transcription termination factor MTEF1, chloroplastic [Phoenix dactylifera]|uniref:Transcription termination factor MTEF1, chloroplastic n=1 Tax=Phoenix dactylifera TaxID=42345 RepID=A0A8B7BT21_PHODC|nr:transcription termination factor MTEF1, chloroplastic [Phoenix dactylifera]